MGPSSVTERASDDQRLGSLDDTVFAVKLSRVENWPDWGPNYSVASFFLLPWTSVHRKQVTRVLWILILITGIVSLHLCKEYLTAIKLKTLFLLQIKYWMFWYVDYSALTQSNTLENAWIGRNMSMVNSGWVVILVKHGFIRLLQRIFNCDKMHDIIITSDEVLNSLVYGSPFYVIKAVKNDQDFHGLN